MHVLLEKAQNQTLELLREMEKFTLRVRRSIEICASPDTVYRFLNQFEKYPEFCNYVRAVASEGARRLSWKTVDGGGQEVEWEAEILQSFPSSRLSWRSTTPTGWCCSMTIAPIPNATCLMVHRSYVPEMIGPDLAAARNLVAQRLNEDLERLKGLIESRSSTVSPALSRTSMRDTTGAEVTAAAVPVAPRTRPVEQVGVTALTDFASAPRVFVSYSYDSNAHAARVLALADALRDLGINVILDRYVHPAPAKGWPRWMDWNLDVADFVLMVCTETYGRRVMGLEELGKGLGARFEGGLIFNWIRDDKPGGSRFIPILLPGSEPMHIPNPVQGHTHYQIETFDFTDPGFEALYRHLTNQPATPGSVPGSIKSLPQIQRPQPSPGPLPPSGGPWWNVPYLRNPYFTGRAAILAQIEAALASDTPAALSQAIAGLGGIGKTQTAIEYAYRHRDQYRAVLWVRADTETNLVSGYCELAEVLDLPEKDLRDSNEVVAAVRRWLGREPDYLLILDNADDPSLVELYLPPDPRGHVLLTSSVQTLDVLSIRKPIELPVMTPDEALEFLLKRTHRAGPLDAAERDAARALADELGYLPLALEQATANMVEQEKPFSVYLASYRILRLKLLDKMGPVTGYPEILRTIRTTWKCSFEAVAAESPASIELLRLSAFFAPYPIPYEMILEGASELGELLASAPASPGGGDFALDRQRNPLDRLLNPLKRYSLVRHYYEERFYAVHRLVQAVLRDELNAAECRDLAERAVKVLNRTFPDADYANWPRCERLLPHALTVQTWIEMEDLRIPEAARLLNRVGYYLCNRARYTEAEPLLRRALTIREKRLGPDHPETARSLNDLAVLLRVRGRYEEAEPLLRRALAIREKVLGPDHPDTAVSLNNLALLLQAQIRYGEAEPLFRRALAIRERVLGPDHPDTAYTLHDLAKLLWNQSRLKEAEPLLCRALAIREQALGPDHPRTAASLDNLAALFQAQGRYGEAEPLFRRALAIREQALGPDHPDTAISLNNLALLLQAQIRYGEAEPLFRRALAIREQALGPDHPDTAISLNDLAALLRGRGRYGEAEPLFRRALAIREQALGPDHPDTAISLNDLAALLRGRGRYGEAEPLLRRALAIREKVLGPDHTRTATSLDNLAALLRGRGRLEEAEPLLRRALAVREQVLGPDHPETATSLSELAEFLRAQGRPGEAEPLLHRALAIREKALGRDHPETATSLSELAEFLRAQGRPGEAEPLFCRALAIYETKLGPEHPRTVTCRENLATLLSLPDRESETDKEESRATPEPGASTPREEAGCEGRKSEGD